jgi:tetratricopeptide (TPR) repeat protein
VPRPTFFHPFATSLLVAGLLVAGPAVAFAAAPLRVLPTGGLRVESAALLLSGEEGGTVPFAALAFPFPGEGDKARVSVVVEIDGTDLLAGQSDPLLRIEVSLYALTGTGSVQGSRMDTIEIDLEQLGTGVGESGVRYVGELSLLPDTYRLRILVRNTATGELGLRTLPVSVPPFRKSSGILLPPAFADPGPDLWITARPSGDSPLAALAPADPPSARPILAPDEEASLLIAGWRLGTDSLRVQLSRRTVDEERREKQEKVADLPVRVTGRRQGPGELEVFTVTFRPEDFEPGEYDLRATIPRSAADTRGDDFSLATRIVLFPGGARGSVWAALNSGGQSTAQVTRKVEPAPQKRRKPSPGPIRQSYREALARLAAGDPAEAATAVGDLETSLLTGKGRYASEDVAEIEADVARALARAKPEILEPVFMLHQRLYRDASEKRNYLLVSHAREVALRIAAVHADLHRTPEGRARTARLLLGLAADLLKTAPPGLRERTYQRILELDETNQEALLCRAVDLERQGKYPAAVETIERLLRFHPGHGEGRLRLAVNRIRLGNAREGRRLLEELVSTPPDQVDPIGLPVALLARQELVRHLLRQNELAAAESLAREGLERSPGEEKLMLQLALIQDLKRDARGARETLDPLETRPHPPEPVSARHFYNALPLGRLEALRDELATTAAGHFADLAAALGRGEAP